MAALTLSLTTRTAVALDEADPGRPRRIAAAELTTIQIDSYLRGREADEPEPPLDTRLVAELEGFLAAHDTGALADASVRLGVADVLADGELILARLALTVGDLGRAEQLLASAAQRCLAAERPWQAVEPLSLRASVLAAGGDLEPAESTARTALGHAAELTEGEEQAAVRLTLADVLLRRGGQAEEAALHALDAAHWLDQAGLAADGGARARLLLARAYADAQRTAEAAEVLQSALPDLLEHGDEEAVQARQTLGGLLSQLHDPRAAAEQYLLAAETAKGWDAPRPQASLAHSAAEALASAGLRDESERAYARALELWQRAGDNPVGEVRALRSLAWLAVDEETAEAEYRQARALMEQALAVLDGTDEPALHYERAQTWQQLARLLEDTLYEAEAEAEDEAEDEDEEEDEDRDSAQGSIRAEDGERAVATREEVVQLFEQAAAVYTEFGDDALRDRFQCLVRAAWTEHALGRTQDGIARMTALIAEFGELEGAGAARLLRQAEEVRKRLGEEGSGPAHAPG